MNDTLAVLCTLKVLLLAELDKTYPPLVHDALVAELKSVQDQIYGIAHDMFPEGASR